MSSDRRPIKWAPAEFTRSEEALGGEIGPISVVVVMKDDRFVLGWTIAISGDGATLPAGEEILRDVAGLIEAYIDSRA